MGEMVEAGPRFFGFELQESGALGSNLHPLGHGRVGDHDLPAGRGGPGLDCTAAAIFIGGAFDCRGPPGPRGRGAFFPRGHVRGATASLGHTDGRHRSESHLGHYARSVWMVGCGTDRWIWCPLGDGPVEKRIALPASGPARGVEPARDPRLPRSVRLFGLRNWAHCLISAVARKRTSRRQRPPRGHSPRWGANRDLGKASGTKRSCYPRRRVDGAEKRMTAFCTDATGDPEILAGVAWSRFTT